ncbi:MAG: efflux RND transporter periplasmic adaptor subunit, partial [Planctomycetota bacterium]
MTKILARVGRITFLVALTAVAGGVMWWVSRPNTEGAALAAAGRFEPPSLAAQPRMLVRVEPVTAAMRDVGIRFSGKIQAWESYTLGFEIGGRVAELGVNPSGEPLDDGDRVEAGQLLARLDDRVLRARKGEAAARFELAASDVERARRVRARSPTALTEADFQSLVTTLAQAKAAQEIAIKNLEDSVLIAPVAGTIVRRRVEPGESVAPNEAIFELVENDRLRLVVNVPEARVRELELRRRHVEAVRRGEETAVDPECAVFRA